MNLSLSEVTSVAGLALAMTFAPINSHAADRKTAPPVANATNQFTIAGMHCNGCARGLASELSRARGVASASVSLANKLAVVAYDTNRTSTTKLVKVIIEAGFKAEQVSH